MPGFDALEEMIAERVSAGEVPAFAVAMADQGRTVWERAFGEGTLDTPFSLASITKPMAATALTILVEQGKIALDRPADDYLGPDKLTAWIEGSEQATVARLANHTAGLPVHHHFFADGAKPPSFPESMRRYGNIVAPPGEAHTYSNFGYGILGEIVARVAGIPLREFMREKLFAPLRMADSYMEPDATELERCAPRYRRDGERLSDYVTDHPAASEAFASARDLIRFGSLFFDDSPFLDRNALLRMQSPVGDLDCEKTYALGLRLGTTKDGLKTIGHAGGMEGVDTRLLIVPDRGTVVAILANSTTALAGDVLTQLRQILFDEEPVTAAGAEILPLADTFKGMWRGKIVTYAGEQQVRVTITDDEVGAALDDASPSPATATADEAGFLTVKLKGKIATPDACKTDHDVELRVKRRGDKLNGCATARSKPGTRLGNGLSHWAELER